MSTNINITETCKLYNDDCMSLLKKLPDSSVDMVLVDPPYGISQSKWDKVLPWHFLWLELERVCKESAAIAMFSASKFTFEMVSTNFRNFRYKYTWVKNFSTGFPNANKMPMKRSEEICIFYQKQPTYNPQRYETDKPAIVVRDKAGRGGKYIDIPGEVGKVRTYDNTRLYDDVLNFKAEPINGRLHVNQKPIALLEHLIKTYTNEGDAVLDFCMGSGSTGVAALNLNRAFVGCELDPNYFDIAAKRISDAVKQKEAS